jgi:signal peptidase I
MNDESTDEHPAVPPTPACHKSAGRIARVRSWLLPLLLAVAFAFVIRTTAVEAFVIPSESMTGTLQVNDRILVEKTPLDFNGFNRGDIVVFERPASSGPDTPQNLVKRIIAVAGDTVKAREGVLYLNGSPLEETYVSSPTSDFGPFVIPEASLWVMGDNRANSADSRVFGPITESSVIGSAFARMWPPTRIGRVG